MAVRPSLIAGETRAAEQPICSLSTITVRVDEHLIGARPGAARQSSPARHLGVTNRRDDRCRGRSARWLPARGGLGRDARIVASAARPLPNAVRADPDAFP